MTTITYPTELEFDIADSDDRAAVLDAARQLGLAIHPVEGTNVFFVTVYSPKEAYEFGAFTQAHFVKRARRL